ncbi:MULTISPECIES: hypothetical protein [Streptomyces]|uniref:Uncharacterized protein n=1 Tax=Streptomyces doudnae TaxID=3075536 RepID=A0ABD5ELT0_9ACTN|nr:MULTISPECIES: hypothetical protein [unclassified Streptomyces]MDT0435611.1 hypothetical protein [Streptomyces sp. DSM 41981]SCD40040.1 hypothetical protein GA0115242_104870 [Streptomyces sp. SolWspMP-5a-2]
MDDIAYAWTPITKAEEQDDGTYMVYGPAASSHLDRDRQRLNSAWLDTAMPAWFAEGANVREQHDAKRAVGVGVGLVKGDGDSGHMLASHIVDPVACLKVKHKVLKGYSVGIKGPKVRLGKADAPGGEVVGGDIVEVSIVDRPCNPTTLFEIAKADGAGELEAVEGTVVEKSDAASFGIADELYAQLPAPVQAALNSLAAAGASVTTETVKADEAGVAIAAPSFLLKVAGQPVTEEMVQGLVDARVERRLSELGKADLSAAARRRAAQTGAAMDDGSYPIRSKAELRKAIKAVGRSGSDHDAIRKHIIKRARALGLEGMVPENWNGNGSLKESEKADTSETGAAGEQPAVVEQAESILRDLRALVPALTKADGDDGEEEGEAEINGADAAVACIAKLIIAEAECLAGGDLRKAISIGLLLDAVRSLKWFKREQDAADQMALADTAKADAPDTGKKEEAPEAGASPEKTASATAEAPLTKADVAELVTSALAEAGTAQEERIQALTGELTKATQTIEALQAQPVPGGPALTRTAAETSAARKSDSDQMRADAAALLAKADACQDRDLREGYLERRRELLVKADA